MGTLTKQKDDSYTVAKLLDVFTLLSISQWIFIWICGIWLNSQVKSAWQFELDMWATNDDDDNEDDLLSSLGRKKGRDQVTVKKKQETYKQAQLADAESDTNDEYDPSGEGSFYDPQKPTDCVAGCGGIANLSVA